MRWANRPRSGPRHEPPRWEQATGRPRVVVEHTDPSVRDVLQHELEARGYDVLTCPGPKRHDDEYCTCPLLNELRCPAVDGADAVVSGLDLQHDDGRAIVTNIATSRPTRPLIIESPVDSDVPADVQSLDNVHVLFRIGLSRLFSLLDPGLSRRDNQ